MEGNKVEYITRDQIKDLDPSLIVSMTMTSGSILVFNHELGDMNYYASQANYQTNQNLILRAKKAENPEEEEKVQLEEVLPQEETGNKQVLRGPDGKPLLMDMLTGDNLTGQEQPQMEENLYQDNGLPFAEQQLQEQSAQIENNVNQEPGVYPPQEVFDNNEGEQFVEPNIPMYEPVQETNIPVEEGAEGFVEAEYYDQNQGEVQEPVNEYPDFGDEVPEQYPQNQQEYQANEEMVEQGQVVQPEYYPENVPQVVPPGEQLAPQPQMVPPQTEMIPPSKKPIQPMIRPLLPRAKEFAKLAKNMKYPLINIGKQIKNRKKFIDPKKVVNTGKKIINSIFGKSKLNIVRQNIKKNVQNVFRARRRDDFDYSNYQQQEVLCPQCAQEVNNNTYGYSQCGVEGSNNFNFHEIVETSDNSKSYVVAKKGGVTVSYDQ